MASKTLKSKKLSKSGLETEEQTLSVKIPHWPYEKWELTKMTTEETKREAEIAGFVPPKHSIPTVVGPIFDKFLQCFSQQLGIHNNSTNSEVLNEITTMLKESLDELGRSYECFEKYQLVQAGSVAEKTKIEAPDEFDFLIVLDYFATRIYSKLL